MKRLSTCLLAGLLALPQSLWAWSNHTLGSYLALRQLPALTQAPDVEVEPLESFISQQRAGLVKLLDEQEAYAREHFRQYPPRPDDLRLAEDGRDDLRKAFLMALRLNPEIKLATAVQPPPGGELAGGELHKQVVLQPADVLVFRNLSGWNQWRFVQLQAGEKVPALDVLASAADEPDFGHDINLFSDNPGDAGQRYGFGTQPFGDPRYEFSSQAPFHMGFYHEDAIIFTGAPYLERNWPEWRAYQFHGLARFAFDTGHPYWGYRFLGWAMHYIQDMTQPYHSTPLPGETTASMLWTAGKSMAGFDADKQAAIQRVADRHTGVERYEIDWLRETLRQGGESPLLAAYADVSGDGSYPPYSTAYLREVVASESHAHAAAFDAAIGHWLDNQKVPAGDFSAGNSPEPFRHDAALDEQIVQLIRHFGAHSRNIARAALQP